MRETGYREQYDRMMRWFSKLQEIYNQSEKPQPGPVQEFFRRGQDRWEPDLDIVYAFFQNCYHLLDWIEKDSEIVTSKSQLRSFRDKNDSLVCCMDICNGSKHCDLKKVNLREHTDLVEQNGKALLKNAYQVVHKKGQWDALKLAKCCIDKLDEFIDMHKVAK